MNAKVLQLYGNIACEFQRKGTEEKVQGVNGWMKSEICQVVLLLRSLVCGVLYCYNR